jgi:hypothetical protein
MIALGLACENVAMIVGQPWCVQVSTTINDMQLIMEQDRSMVDLLGHHQRVDRFLRHRNRYVLSPWFCTKSDLTHLTEPGFYHFGYAWPLHYVVEGSRQILFDLHSRLGIDFGVLIAWGAVNTIVFPFACYFMRWKSKHHVHEYYK